MKQLTRHQFLAAITAVGATAVGCGSDSEESGSGGSAGSSGSSGSGGGSSGGSAGASSGGAGGSSGGTGGSGGSGGGTGGSGGSAGSPGTGGSAGGGTAACDIEIDAQITCRHGHDLVISVADLQAGVSKTYDIRGSASHSHMVEVTAAMFAQLKAGQTVVIDVPSQFQPHKVHISCANPPSHLLDDTECN